MSPTLSGQGADVKFLDTSQDMCYYVYMTDNKCKTCNLSPELKSKVEQWIDVDKLGDKTISKKLLKVDIEISSHSIKRHRLNHMKQKPQTLLGVVEAPMLSNYDNGTAYVTIADDTGEVKTREYLDSENPDELIKDTAQILREHRVDPEVFEIVGSVGMSRYQVGGEWKTSFRFRFEKKKPVSEDGEVDLPLLYMNVKDRSPIREVIPTNKKRALVVSFSDAQTGKVDSRGGSEELIERVLDKKQKLKDHVSKINVTSSVFLDGGDIVESFDNTAQQGFTNDLSIMDQVDLAITLEEELLSVLSNKFMDVTVAGVPSNHAAWRRGKDYLGKPSDDWGLFSLKQIERLYSRLGTYTNVSFQYPESWSKSLVVDVLGHGVGLTHGDEVNRPEGIPDWWAKQVHGGSPLARAEILVSAHFHTFRAQNCGRTPDGIQKWWLQSPCLDNGSSWYANKAGGDSDPGLLVFEVDEETGFDLKSLTIL